MTFGEVFEFSRPRWPGPAQRDSAATARARAAWLLLGTVFTAFAMASQYFVNVALAPVQSGMRRLVGSRRQRRAWAWACTAAATIGGVALASRGDRSSSIRDALVVIAAGYLLLGLLRASSMWAMERESSYEGYDAMLAQLDRGLTGWFIRRLRRKEDVVWIRHVALSTLVHLPPTLSLVVWGATSWFARAWFVVMMLAIVKTAGANHNIGHSRPFVRFGQTRFDRAVGSALAVWYHFVVEFLEGDVPHLTISGHNLIHHVENNGPGDFESSYPYDRTSFVSSALLYLNCALSYSFGSYVLPYLWRRRATRQYRVAFWQSVAGLAYTYALLVAFALLVDLRMALVVLGLRLLQSGLRYGIFAYTSHAFVDPDDPTNSFSNSMEASTRGTLMLGGGQHALHHWRPGRHWARLKADRGSLPSSYADNGTVVFPYEFIPYVQPLLLAKRFDDLARWMMAPKDVAAYEAAPEARDWPASPRPRAERVAHLERRARPASWAPPGRLVATVDAIAARALLWSSGANKLEVHALDVQEQA